MIALAICAVQSLCFAAIRRVGFFAAPIPGTDYSTFAAAYTAAAQGDTLLVFPGIPAINQIFAKKIIIIGPGSWLDPLTTPKGNAAQQAFAGTVSINSLTFNAGSDGSVVMGLEGGNIYVANASNITVRRNREVTVVMTFTSPAASISNLQILENYRVTIQSYYTNGSAVTNMNVSNNFITSFTTASLNTYSGFISNNVWAFDATLTAGLNGGSSTMTGTSEINLGGGAYLFQNNILASYTNASLASNYNYFSFQTLPILFSTITLLCKRPLGDRKSGELVQVT